MPGVGEVSETAPAVRYRLTAEKMANEESLASFLARPVRIMTATVTGGTLITASSFPGSSPVASLLDQWRVTPGVANKLQGYGLFRGTPRVTISVTGSPVMMGTVLFSFCPASTANPEGANYPAAPPWFHVNGRLPLHDAMPGVRCGVEKVETYTIDLPWCLASPVLDIKLTSARDWYIWAQLANLSFRRNDGLTVDPVTFEVYVSYHNVELSQPIVINGATEVEGPWLSSRLKYAASIMSQAAVPFPFITPWAAVTGALGSFAASMGFARSYETAMSIERIDEGGNVSYMSGAPFFGHKLASDPAVATDVSGAFIPLSLPGDTSLSWVCSKWGLIYGAGNGVAPTTGVSVVIAAHPMSTRFSTILTTSPCLTALGFASLPFTYFSGDLEFKFEFESNALVRCRYAIQVIPRGVLTPTTYVGASFFHTTLVDVVGRTEVVIPVKFESANLWERLEQPTSSTSTASFRPRIVVFALDTLPVSQIVGMSTWVRAGPNYKVTMPNAQRLSMWSLAPVAVPPAFKAGGAEEEEMAKLPEAMVVEPAPFPEVHGLCISSYSGPLPKLPVLRTPSPQIHGCNDDASLGMACYGSNVTDLTALARKPTPFFSFDAFTGGTMAFDPLDMEVNGYNAFGPTTSDVILSSYRMPLCHYLRSAYLGYSGGYRLTIFDQSPTAATVIASTYASAPQGALALGNLDYNGMSSLGCTRLPSRTERRVLEFEGRADPPLPFRPGMVVGDVTVNTPLPVFALSGVTKADVFVCGADDYVFHGYVCPPFLYLKTSP